MEQSAGTHAGINSGKNRKVFAYKRGAGQRPAYNIKNTREDIIMKTIMFPKDQSSHIIPKDAVYIIVGFEKWDRTYNNFDFDEYMRNEDISSEDINLEDIGFADDDEINFTADDVPFTGFKGKNVYGTEKQYATGEPFDGKILLMKYITTWQRINGPGLYYWLLDIRLKTNMKLVYGYAVPDENDTEEDLCKIRDAMTLSHYKTRIINKGTKGPRYTYKPILKKVVKNEEGEYVCQ